MEDTNLPQQRLTSGNQPGNQCGGRKTSTIIDEFGGSVQTTLRVKKKNPGKCSHGEGIP